MRDPQGADHQASTVVSDSWIWSKGWGCGTRRPSSRSAGASSIAPTSPSRSGCRLPSCLDREHRHRPTSTANPHRPSRQQAAKPRSSVGVRSSWSIGWPRPSPTAKTKANKKRLEAMEEHQIAADIRLQPKFTITDALRDGTPISFGKNGNFKEKPSSSRFGSEDSDNDSDNDSDDDDSDNDDDSM